MQTETNADWLQKLQTEIWEEKNYPMRANLSGTTWNQKALEVKRRLTQEELAKLKLIAADFLVLPHNAGMGFNFGITLYSAPLFPGLKPDFVCSFEGHHLPEGMDQRFDKAWAEFSPLSHNPENARKLVHFGHEEPKDIGYYSY